MSLRILNVAYPFAPAGPDAVGGAEQVLTLIDQALVAAGHESWVLGCGGSRAFGQVIASFELPDNICDSWKETAYQKYSQRIEETIDRCAIDLLHLHGIDFYRYLPDRPVPVLVTLHLPPLWYPPSVFQLSRPNVWLHCVSPSQHTVCPASPNLLPPIENGVDLPKHRQVPKRNFALSLGRICPEKGFHLAMDAAKAANIPLLLAGQVFPYEAHLKYFEDEIRSRQSASCKFIGPLAAARKWGYLSAAKCLLVPSLVAETSSLVAMEALACGTPVIAFARGALPQIVEHGKTGFIVHNVDEMAEAIREVAEISPEDCRAAAQKRFSAGTMTERYLSRYLELVRLRADEHVHREPEFATA
ncbi:MAG TPA: glycosyltransferase [Verrucomicrobiae bacterium]|nr:glycosyltransferase [Verrucomicrobiae bacterium]